jgi:hypothetical protein
MNARFAIAVGVASLLTGMLSDSLLAMLTEVP